MYLDDEPIVVACAADDNYSMPLAVTVCSLLQNLKKGQRLCLFLLDGGIRQPQKDRILKSINCEVLEVRWIKPSEILSKTVAENLPLSDKWPIAAYYRLLLPEIIPQHFKKVIYVDTDLVIQGDLSQLWTVDIGDNYALAVQDVCQPYISMTKHLDYKKLGISQDCKYFNSGVLVINLQRWRNDQIVERTLEFITKNAESLLFPDQDALNVVLVNQWKELEPEWNQMHGIYEFPSWKESPYNQESYDRAIQHPSIIHFTTLPKPWMKNCIHPKKEVFYQYLDLTAWAGWRNTFWRRLWRRISKELNQLVQF